MRSDLSPIARDRAEGFFRALIAAEESLRRELTTDLDRQDFDAILALADASARRHGIALPAPETGWHWWSGVA